MKADSTDLDQQERSITILAVTLFMLAALTHVVSMQNALAGRDMGSVLGELDLSWRPVTELAELGPIDLTGWGQMRIEVADFVDRRANPALVGENRTWAEDGVVQPVTTQDDVADWAASHVRLVLEEMGLEVVESGGDIVLSGEVRRLFVTEDRSYLGEVGLLLRATDPLGKTRFLGTTGGVTRRFGRSFERDTYVEALSEALLEAVHRVVTTDGFRRALAGA